MVKMAFTLTLNKRQRCDLELLLTGGFASLSRYLGAAHYETVLTGMRLAAVHMGTAKKPPTLARVEYQRRGPCRPGLCVGAEQEERLQKIGYRPHIQRRGQPGRPISRRNRRIARTLARVEHVFAGMTQMGG